MNQIILASHGDLATFNMPDSQDYEKELAFCVSFLKYRTFVLKTYYHILNKKANKCSHKLFNYFL